MKKQDIRTLEGCFPVNGDVTPISRQPITSIDASQWPKMSLSQLLEQRAALEQRMYVAMQDNIGIASQMQQGLNALDQLIVDKSDTEDDGTFSGESNFI